MIVDEDSRKYLMAGVELHHVKGKATVALKFEHFGGHKCHVVGHLGQMLFCAGGTKATFKMESFEVT